MDKPLRICFIVQNLVHLGKWARYLAERGHDIHIIGMEDPNIPEVSFYPFQFQQVENYLLYILNIPRVRGLIGKIKPDVVHAYYATNSGLVGALTAGRRPLMISVAGNDVYDAKKSIFFRRINGFAFRRAGRINAGAQSIANMVMEYGVPPSKIDVFPKGINLTLFTPSDSEEDSVERHPVIICNRRFEPVYNLRLLVEAMPAIRKELPGARFIMIGKGGLKSEIGNLIREKGMQDAVEINDEIPNLQMPGFLQRSNVYVSTSLSDGTSVSLLEAMATGCFPVVTDIPTNREWVADGENGFLVPVDRPDVLAEKVVRAVRERRLRTEAKKKNLAIVKSKAEEGLIMDGLVKCYRKMIEPGAKSKDF